MTEKVVCGNKKRKTDLTTAQLSCIVKISYGSLYVYVRNFPEYFSPGARKHTKGRSWTQEDLELVQSIRCLYHENTGTAEIRGLLASGWRLENQQIWVKELISILLNQNLMAQEEARDSVLALMKCEDLLDERTRNNQEFQEMWIHFKDLEHEWEVMQKAWRLRTVIKKAVKVKKKYHGKLPELYPPGESDSGLVGGDPR